MLTKRLILCLVALSLATPLAAEPLRLSEPVERTASYEVFGQPLDDKREGQSLGALLASADEIGDGEIRVTTSVAKVCQKKGCFFIATDGAASARVTFADYSFFIPTDSAGKQVTLVGTLSQVELSPERAAHYAQDLGEAVAVPDQPVVEYAIVASSVLIPRS